MNIKSLILTVAGLFALGIIYNVHIYNKWLNAKIFTISNIPEQMEHLELEHRRSTRYAYSYIIYKDIANKMSTTKDVTILLPPQKYLTAQNVTNLLIVEPATLYYYTGLNSVTIKSPKVATANYAIVVPQNGQVSLLKIKDKEQLDSQIAIFSRYQ